MSTRGAIARIDGDGFKGVYHHWDSYPTGLGRTLYQLYRERYKSDLTRMLKELIDDHPAGWSTINDADMSVAPGYGGNGPQCYCHGDRHEEANVVTMQNASDIGVEYAYVFRERDNHMLIMSSYNEDGTRMIGMFGMGNPDAKWRIIADIALDGPEPDWEHLASAETSSRP